MKERFRSFIFGVYESWFCMKKGSRILLKLGIALLLIVIAAVACYFIFFHNADVLQLEGGVVDNGDGSITISERKIKGAKPTWLTGFFDEGSGENYYKLADVTAPSDFKSDKTAADLDGDVYTTQFAYQKKDGSMSVLIYVLPISEQGAFDEGYAPCTLSYVSDGSARGNSKAKEKKDINALVLEEEGKNTYLLYSPYECAFICAQITYDAECGEEQILMAAYNTAEKIVPGKQLHPFVADFKLNFIDDNRWNYLLTGLGMTLLITLTSGMIGIVIGAVVAAIRSTWQKNNENMRPGPGKAILCVLDKICNVYLTVIRGTPVMVQLLIMYLIIFASSSNGTVAAILAFGINSGAYVAEIIRGGIMSIDNGQFEAGRSLGFNYLQTMWHIVLPQVFKSILPTLANEFIALLKETSVSGYVAVRDLNKGGEIIRSVTYSPFLPLLAVAGIYLALVMFFTWLVGKLERRLRSSDH